MADREVKEIDVIITPRVDQQKARQANKEIDKLESRRRINQKIVGTDRQALGSLLKSSIKDKLDRGRPSAGTGRLSYIGGLQAGAEEQRKRFSLDREAIRHSEIQDKIRARTGAFRAEEYLKSKGYSGKEMFAKNKGGFYKWKGQLDKESNKGLYNMLTNKMKRMLGPKDGAYANSPFRKAMMYVGSAMLMQYAVMMVGRSIAAVATAVADTEVKSLKGRYYREDLIKRGGDVQKFDRTVQQYSNISGEATYSSRAKFADFFGQLKNRGINADAIAGDKLVRVMRGMEFMTGETPEQVDKRLIKLLSGKLSKEERKEFGISSRNNPVAILNEIHETLLKNSSARVGMENMLLRDQLKAVVEAPKNMLDMVHSNFPIVFNDIVKGLREFTQGFFDPVDPDVQKRWVAFFSTIREFTNTVLTKENGQAVATFFLDTVGPVVATLNNMADAILKLNKATDGAVGNLVKIGTQMFMFGTFIKLALWPFTLLVDKLSFLGGFFEKLGIGGATKGAETAGKTGALGFLGAHALKLGVFTGVVARSTETGVGEDEWFNRYMKNKQNQFSLTDRINQNIPSAIAPEQTQLQPPSLLPVVVDKPENNIVNIETPQNRDEIDWLNNVKKTIESERPSVKPGTFTERQENMSQFGKSGTFGATYINATNVYMEGENMRTDSLINGVSM